MPEKSTDKLTRSRTKNNVTKNSVYIVDGARTPYLKARGPHNPFSASDLAVHVGRNLLLRQPFSPTEIGEVILGCIMPRENEANIARLVSLRLGCGDQTPAWTVQRNCASGMQAIDSGIKDIQNGRHQLVLVGGTEAMSRAPLILNDDMTNWLVDFKSANNFSAKMKSLLKLRPKMLTPIIALMHGLTDSLIGMNMGQTAEQLAYLFNIDRTQMDQFAVMSHQRLAQAQANNYLTEIEPLYSPFGKVYHQDDGVRSDSTLEKLAKLKPIFDRKFGKVTAGNSSQVTDGACLLLLASEQAVEQYRLPVLAKIVDTQWAGLAPNVMGLGPVMATTPILQRNQLNLTDIDYWEINEAFAAQVLACLRAWEDEDFCRQHLDLENSLGTVDSERLNVDGGGIAMGHPVGSSGARIVLHLSHVLARNQAKRGIASICIGGGQGGAILIENIS